MKSPLPVSEYVLVTPEMAKEWLKLNIDNRNINLQRVRDHAAAMTRKHWVTTHQGIAFGSDGTLYDGQHRLMAIIRSGIPTLMLVTRGLSVEARAVIDRGMKRSLTHALQILGMKLTRNQTSWLNNLGMYPSDEHGTRESYDIEDLKIRYEAGFLAARTVFSSHISGITKAAVVSAFIYAWAEDPEKILTAMRGYYDMTTFGCDHPINVLQAWVAKLPNSDENIKGGIQLRKVFLRSLDLIAAYLDGVQKPLSSITKMTDAQELFLLRRFATANDDEVTLTYINAREASLKAKTKSSKTKP